MQLQAGIRPGMDRRTRHILAGQFAQQLTEHARATGQTKNMSRAQIRERQKRLRSLVGGKLVRGN